MVSSYRVHMDRQVERLARTVPGRNTSVYAACAAVVDTEHILVHRPDHEQERSCLRLVTATPPGVVTATGLLGHWNSPPTHCIITESLMRCLADAGWNERLELLLDCHYMMCAVVCGIIWRDNVWLYIPSFYMKIRTHILTSR